uniref:Uncharacterized protein n=1 Tax=Anguilla anguilla TaxID=7936 RepID=A0A0E9TZY4_ANGAN
MVNIDLFFCSLAFMG